MINKIISKFKNSKEDGDENSEENELEGGVDEEENNGLFSGLKRKFKTDVDDTEDECDLI